MRPETDAPASDATDRRQTETIHRSIRFLCGKDTIDECFG